MKQVARQNLARVPGLLLQECTPNTCEKNDVYLHCTKHSEYGSRTRSAATILKILDTRVPIPEAVERKRRRYSARRF